MPASNVSWGSPLTRQLPWYPGQWGVRGSDNKLGLRQHVSGAVFYVDPNHPNRNDAGDGTNPDQPCATIAAAVLKCLPFRGDVIAVMANNSWQYGTAADGYANPIEEDVIVDVPGVRIVGISQSSSTGVVWSPGTDGGTCVTVNAIDVSIEGFLFTEGAKNGCNAIASVWNGTTAWGDNLTVRNCVFDDTVDNAITLDYVWYANIHHNDFWDCDDKGIEVIAPGSGAAFLVISDNRFHNVTTCAMDLSNADDCEVFNNSIYNANAQGAGAATGEGILTVGGARNQVYDNYFSCRLPVPAAGDWDDLNTAAATDSWVGNHCMNGLAVTNPT